MPTRIAKGVPWCNLIRTACAFEPEVFEQLRALANSENTSFQEQVRRLVKSSLQERDEDEGTAEYRLAVAYQVIGSLLDHLGLFDTARGQALLDYFNNDKGAADPLPFSVNVLLQAP